MQNKRSKGRYTQLLVAALAAGVRTAPATTTVTIGTGGAAAGATSVPVTALAAAVAANTVLQTAAGKKIIVSANAAAGATTLTVEALKEAVAAGDTAPHYGLTRVMGVTTSTYSTNPTTGNLGGITYESSEEKQWQDVEVTADSWNIAASAEFDVDDAGYAIINTAHKNGTEVWVRRHTMRSAGTLASVEAGPAIITGFSRPNPADNVATASWTFQGQGAPTLLDVV